ncbi:30S ribosomal protein S9 [Candidatus Parvarchaeota archaeon]|nr:30S ribosomal protein S9 [Candidatus Parvarchaeota archaeon]
MNKNIIFIAKRKTAMAYGSIKEGSGRIYINNKSFEGWPDKMGRLMIKEPLVLSGDIYKKYDIEVRVSGGGNMSRAQTIRAVIAKALSKKEKSLKKIFLEYDRTLLVDDKRQTEPQKPYRSAARALRQTSYR